MQHTQFKIARRTWRHFIPVSIKQSKRESESHLSQEWTTALEKRTPPRTCTTISIGTLQSAAPREPRPLIIPAAWIRGMDFWIYEITHTFCFSICPAYDMQLLSKSKPTTLGAARPSDKSSAWCTSKSSSPAPAAAAQCTCYFANRFIYKLSACAWPAQWVCVYLSLSEQDWHLCTKKMCYCGEV